MTDKIIAYLKALLFISTTILWFVAVDYDKIPETRMNLVFFLLVSGNLVLWSFYYIYKFCKVMTEEKVKALVAEAEQFLSEVEK